MTRSMAVFFAGACVAGCGPERSSLATAQDLSERAETVAVGGYVVDTATDQHVPGISVLAYDAAAGSLAQPLARTVSASDGRYTLLLRPGSTVYVVAQPIAGHFGEEVPILVPDQGLQLYLVLIPFSYADTAYAANGLSRNPADGVLAFTSQSTNPAGYRIAPVNLVMDAGLELVETSNGYVPGTVTSAGGLIFGNTHPGTGITITISLPAGATCEPFPLTSYNVDVNYFTIILGLGCG